MRIVLDVVDLLQLQELWCRRPIVTAFTRLERRQKTDDALISFDPNALLPRLSRLKRSQVWRQQQGKLGQDPGRIPLSSLSEASWQELYPEADSAAQLRQDLFNSAYHQFVVTQYRGAVDQTGRTLRALAAARRIEPGTCLDRDALPIPGAQDWIPADITDDIRCLDERYDPALPGTPAAYVVGEAFWMLLAKASLEEQENAARRQCPDEQAMCLEDCRRALADMTAVAVAWNRSPSVVGLCYQLAQ